MSMHRAALVTGVLACAACATAEVGDGTGEDGATVADASGIDETPDGGEIQTQPDAAVLPPDASPPPDAGPITLSHSATLDIVGANSVACRNANGVLANNYYRVFSLPVEGVSGSLRVTQVTTGIERSTSGGSGIAASVAIHTLNGALQLDNLTELARVDTVIPDVAAPPDGQLGGLLHPVPIDVTVPAGSVMVVELGHGSLGGGRFLFVGSNRAGEEDATYLRGPDCNIGEPTRSADIPVNNGPLVMHWVLEVTGQPGD